MAILDLTKAPHGGRVRLLPDNATAPRSTPRLLIFHSIVGSAEGAWNYFATGTNLESTFIVTLGGQVWQCMDTTREADANYRANPFAVSVETEDHGDPDHEPWTDAQLDALTWLGLECRRIHPAIKLQRANTWDGAGYGYHTMFGAPSPWTPVSKTCPGRVRIQQFNDILLPRILTGEYEVDCEEFYNRLTDPNTPYNLVKIQKGLIVGGTVDDYRIVNVEEKVDTLTGDVGDLTDQVADLDTKLDQVLALLGGGQVPTGGPLAGSGTFTGTFTPTAPELEPEPEPVPEEQP